MYCLILLHVHVGFVGALSVWMLTFLDLVVVGEDLGLPTGQGTLNTIETGEGGGGGE